MDLNKLLSYSVDSGASDLHLSVGSIPMVRINGTMKPLNMDPLKQGDMESILPQVCLLYTSPSPRDRQKSRMPSSA